ncbi:MAG: integrase/recombinase XerD [Flavobacteriales bacterium]|jgi:integrase
MHTPHHLQSSRIPFIDYVPAELKETGSRNWRIVFYVRVPGSTEMKRFRRRVKPIPNRKTRLRYAKRICMELNKKLEQGWSPYTADYGNKDFLPLSVALDRYIEQNQKLFEGGQLRKASRDHYLSMTNLLLRYMKDIGKEEMFCVEFNRSFVINYKDYIYFIKKRSATTVNNYLGFCGIIGNFLLDRGYIKSNSVVGIPSMTVEEKKREVIDVLSRKRIFDYYGEQDPNFLTLCLLIYFCFIRRTEITRLLVGDIQINNGIILLPSKRSKNKKNQAVTIPKKLILRLSNHINGTNAQDYLFSDNNFLPGKTPIKPKKISDTWSGMRKKLELKSTYQFYSLKDTGITQLFLMNVPLIKIRDQARHHDIRMTEKYTPRNYEKDQLLSTIDFDF